MRIVVFEITEEQVTKVDDDEFSYTFIHKSPDNKFYLHSLLPIEPGEKTSKTTEFYGTSHTNSAANAQVKNLSPDSFLAGDERTDIESQVTSTGQDF